ncbi:Put3p NDAI_0C00260 [Naumovozyma dairenensis CBS 421]|uniref:Zn(2)-C6 fungal-type domain-containing protein n=1 Tax=Naumovozyma dairenensis (strain ATCC 10597 / BCRC 20456 / CBS 421 / NBRC 0211 / NRRL Y-12639) TaxID=1071378 RepID=G0W7C6_NAUDC|nr:hypothetical protein NDAI_0C00260 [Naumovozyma dairenensis CBS 421]CCD23687.1 hypothetical protein NDAI_0C00260 [Naumovozyma dairenensis CBS 421]
MSSQLEHNSKYGNSNYNGNNHKEEGHQDIVPPIPRKSNACIQCRRRHVKCPNGNPCLRCVKSKLQCEYSEPSRKIVVSLSYLQNLQDSIITLKKNNLKLQSQLSTCQRTHPPLTSTSTVSPTSMSDLKKILNSDDGRSSSSSNNENDNDDNSGFATHEQSRYLPVSNLQQDLANDVVFNNNTVPNDINAVNHPELIYTDNTFRDDDDNKNEQIESSLSQRSGRLVETPTGQLYFVGSSSMTLFGIEIQALASKYLIDKKVCKPLPINEKEEDEQEIIKINNSKKDEKSTNKNQKKTTRNQTGSIESRKSNILKQRLSLISSLTDPVAHIEKNLDNDDAGSIAITLTFNESSILNDSAKVQFKLPSYQYSLLLIDTFVAYNDGSFYFFNEGIIKNELKIIYNHNRKNETNGRVFQSNLLQSIWYCKILLIFALGEMYHGTRNDLNGNLQKKSSKLLRYNNLRKRRKLNDNNNTTPTRHHNYKNNLLLLQSSNLPGSEFFNEASKIFNCLFSSEHLDCITKDGGVEVLLLYAFYLQVADCTVASYFYFGQALRTCLILGMHVDAQRDTLSRFELEHHRRLWWTVYMFERMLSSKAGLPLSFTDNTISTELPDNFDMNYPPPGCEHYIFPEAEYISNCVKIVQINAQILNQLYQRQPDSNILPTVQNIITKLLNWRNELSSNSQVDFNVPNLTISRLSTNLFTEYFQGINLAVRPLLFHFVSIQLKKFQNKNYNSYLNLQDYPNSITTLLNCSLQSSVNTIRSLWLLMKQNMLALFGYMDREYLFTSSCTLLLFNATFGIHEQTSQYLDQSLEILTKMQILGNNPAGLRKTQLLTMMINLDFHGIMKNLISKYSIEDESIIIEYEKNENISVHNKESESTYSIPKFYENILNGMIEENNTSTNHSTSPAYDDTKGELNRDENIIDLPVDSNDDGTKMMHTPLMNSISRTASLANLFNPSVAPNYQTEPLTDKGNEIIEQNGTQLRPTNYVDNDELQEMLDSLDQLSNTDNKLWKEISDQAMWLGDTMDPTAAVGSELDVKDFLS